MAVAWQKFCIKAFLYSDRHSRLPARAETAGMTTSRTPSKIYETEKCPKSRVQVYKQICVAIAYIISGPCSHRRVDVHTHKEPELKEASLAALPAAKPATRISVKADCGEDAS